jgi:hypothetical protein
MPKLPSAETKLATLRREYNQPNQRNMRGNRAIHTLELLMKTIKAAASTLPETEIAHHLMDSWAMIAEEGLR